MERNSLSHHFLLQTTDKGTWHSYIENYYNNKFTPIRHEKINLLEIGIWWGASIKFWQSWFTNASIYAIDPWPESFDYIKDMPRVTALQVDGYSLSTVDMFEDNFFDFIIEDGPHSLETQMFAAKYWSKKIKPGGSLIIEDIKNGNTDCDIIAKSVPDMHNFTFSVHDYRRLKNRADDVILEIIKNK
jgi:hypothetical protein